MSLYTVIGAAGFVGSRLVSALKAEGCEVFAPARADSGLFDRDLGRVFYCAGLTADYLARPFDTVEAHVGLIARVLKDARFERLVYLSSTRLYDWAGPTGGREDEALTLSPAEPRHLYDLSKALGENLCLTQARGRGVVARLSGVWDWNDGASGFLSEWMQQARRARTLSFESATGSVRDYIHLDDAVRALRAIVDSDAAGIFNVASGENVSNAELAEVFERRGWSVRFARATPKQIAPRCAVHRLHALGVVPRLARSAVEARIAQEDFLAAG
ncbi:MAG TPA: NAD(P)-dependent oxidoreductase [Caulobacteraceae bacterium]|jgi:nucleoside-diphosphate-sugar epimerase|nr:NAD(P)-dependent oxidoreductase [Caulobacteraceae bacterium]